MRSLQFGAVPYQDPGVVVKGYVGKDYFRPNKAYQKKKTYDWKYAFEAVGFAGKENDFRILQAYVAGRAKNWEFSVGRKKEIIGLGDSTLSSGFWAVSGNAMPPVKYSFGTIDYLDFAKGFLGIRMKYADGLLDNMGPTINAYIHQKSLYGRIGKRSSKFNFFAGINHNVSWGGESKVKTGGEFDYYPSGWNTYFYVVIPQKNRTLVAIDPNSTMDDTENQYGNHLGTIDAAFQFKSNLGTFFLYHQMAYETGRVRSLVNANDGITGLSWKINEPWLINHLVIDYLYSANQGNYISGLANLLHFEDTSKYTVENYYNNGGRGGWHYLGKGLGNPMIPIDRESASNGNFAFSMNAVKAYYVGIGGNLPYELSYQFRGSVSRHTYPRYLGTRISNEEMIPQFSWSLTVNGKLKNELSWSAQVGLDNGQRLHNTLGAMFSLRKTL
jgi:hypothetical protein